MSRKKKILLILAAAAGFLAVLFGCLWIYYNAFEWKMSSGIPETERQARLSLIAAAEEWVECRESDGSHKEIIDLYNTQDPLPMDYEVLYTDSWCATFVSAAAMQAGLTDIIPAECGCERQIGLLQQMGIWQEKDTYFPAPGDLIY